MTIPVFQVDAFAPRPFTGNPAAVCPLEAWLPDAQLQAIAMENNLSETAFFIPHGDRFHLRWFTPAVEVDLCGHATLAAAAVLFERLGHRGDRLVFDTRSGEIAVERRDGLLCLDFPSRPPGPVPVHPRLVDALGTQPETVLGARDYLVVFRDEEAVRSLQPDLNLLAAMDRFAVIVTAPGREADFVSRFFAPAQGVPEDPVTGSAHCTLVPYWARRLGKQTLTARQLSARGGELWCEDRGDRVSIAGRAFFFLEGRIFL
jgi:PhzF family phenazine biosynthesis protein